MPAYRFLYLFILMLKNLLGIKKLALLPITIF